MSGKRKHVMLPNRDEQHALRETDMLLKTNLTKLKLEEMLTAVSVEPPSRGSSIDKWLESVQELLKGAKSVKGVGKKWVLKNGVSGLEPRHEYVPKRGDKLKMEVDFVAPEDLRVCGSYALGTQTKPFVSADLLVTIPAACMEDDDVRNGVYLDKRRLYLAVLARALAQSGLVASVDGVRVALFKGDDRKPVLVVKSQHKKKTYTLRIIPCVSSETFNLKHLRASRSNVRPRAWLEAKDTASLDKDVLQPTPDYNSCLLEEVAQLQQADILKSVAGSVPVFARAAVLFKVWLHQKGFRGAMDSMDSHTASLLLLHILETSGNTVQMSPLGVFQVAMKFLADTELSKPGLIFAGMGVGGADLPHITAANLAYPVRDKSGGLHFLNLLWRMGASALDELRACARLTLTVLQNKPAAVYEEVFSTKISFWDRYDLVYAIPVASLVDEDEDEDAREELEQACLDKSLLGHVAAKAAAVVSRALGDRVQTVRVLPEYLSREQDAKAGSAAHYPVWSVGEAQSESGCVLVGIVMDNEKALRSVERGPSPEEEDAADAFVQFWGSDVAQLRRFRDGSIVHAVAWPAKTGRGVIDACVRHSLGRHLPLQAGPTGARVTHTGSELELAIASAAGGGGDGLVSAAVLTAIKALDGIKSLITAELEGMPLRVETVSPATQQLRYTSLVAPRKHPLLMAASDRRLTGDRLSLIQAPLHILGTLEASGKWPSNPDVAAKLKTAFLLQISSLLKRQKQVASVPHEDCLDIMWEGYIFRLELCTSAEKDTWAYMPLESIAEDVRDATLGPLHHSIVHSFQTLHPSYGDAVRLLQYWLAKSTFSGHVAAELVELVVASVYLAPLAEHAPSTAEGGFRRGLVLLGSFDWESSPFVVDFNNDIAAADMAKMAEDLAAARADPAGGPSMYCVASYDRVMGFRPHFARRAPERVVLQMIGAAARATSDALDERSVGALEARTLGDSLRVLEHVIAASSELTAHLSLLLVFNKTLAYSGKKYSGGLETCAAVGPSFANAKLFANSPTADLSHTRLVVTGSEGLCPVQEELVKALRASYGHYALFFWDETVGSRLGVVLRPKASLPLRFSVLEARHRIVCPGKRVKTSQDAPGNFKDVPMTVLNTTELIAEMLALGDGRIQDVLFL